MGCFKPCSYLLMIILVVVLPADQKKDVRSDGICFISPRFCQDFTRVNHLEHIFPLWILEWFSIHYSSLMTKVCVYDIFFCLLLNETVPYGFLNTFH